MILVFGCFLFPNEIHSQLKKNQFEDVENLQKNNSRNLVIFIHTDWCQYCKTMQNTTFRNEKVVEVLNKNFYFIELNAEEKRPIIFAGKIFNFKPTGKNIGIHELAENLGNINGKHSYPALIILNPNNEIIFQHTEFINGDDFLKILTKIN